MKKILMVLAGLALATTMSSAQSRTVKGTLIDNACFKPKISQADLAKHTRECAMMPNCEKAGYAVVTADGMVYKLDAKGNTDIVAALKASTRTNDLRVTVMGAVTNDTIAVSSIALDK